MASNSVGMFQRPVEYKVNCLDFNYQIDNLSLNYIYYEIGYPMISRVNMTYIGNASLLLCFFPTENVVLVTPVFNLDVEMYADISYTDEQRHDIKDESINLKNRSYLLKKDFYEKIKQSVRNKMLSIDIDSEFANSANIVFNFRYGNGSNQNFYNSTYYLRRGHVYDSLNDSYDYVFNPVSFDIYGHSLFIVQDVGQEPTHIFANNNLLDSTYNFKADSLEINELWTLNDL